jgi:hypothetical protein
MCRNAGGWATAPRTHRTEGVGDARQPPRWPPPQRCQAATAAAGLAATRANAQILLKVLNRHIIEDSPIKQPGPERRRAVAQRSGRAARKHARGSDVVGRAALQGRRGKELVLQHQPDLWVWRALGVF